MRRYFVGFSLLPLLLILLSGCHAIGDKSASLSVIYGATAVLSLLLLVGYCSVVPKKDPWFLLLFSSVLVVNAGYFALAISQSLEEALLANRISYLGSVFLPMSMLMIILNVARIQYKKWQTWLLLGISVLVFFVAASPGYLTIYYKEVSFEIVNGLSVLHKVYGPWHSLYLYYLLGYFAAMTGVIIYATAKKKIETTAYTIILLIAVLVNLGVWFIEQVVHINFEILSVSYIITELFLLGVHLVMEENARLKNLISQREPAAVTGEPTAAPEPGDGAASLPNDRTELFLVGLAELTPTERTIYEAYIVGTSTKDIMQTLCIKENTLKYHNKNLYGKLGVSSRKQLMEVYKQIKTTQRHVNI